MTSSSLRPWGSHLTLSTAHMTLPWRPERYCLLKHLLMSFSEGHLWGTFPRTLPSSRKVLVALFNMESVAEVAMRCKICMLALSKSGRFSYHQMAREAIDAGREPAAFTSNLMSCFLPSGEEEGLGSVSLLALKSRDRRVRKSSRTPMISEHSAPALMSSRAHLCLPIVRPLQQRSRAVLPSAFFMLMSQPLWMRSRTT